jgi:5-formyltetrahydrofolate cyclo-ligase
MKDDEKDRLRRELLARRREMGEEEVDAKSRAVQARVEGLVWQRGAKTVMSYVSVRNEVRTQGLIASLLRDGIVVAVPLCLPETLDLLPCRIDSLEDDLEKGHLGIPEPKPARRIPLPLGELDVVLVPGVAFDRCGYRLGHGCGYYDRFLAGLAPGVPKVGLAYDWQVVEKLPREVLDVPVDFIATEKEIVTPPRAGA